MNQAINEWIKGALKKTTYYIEMPVEQVQETLNECMNESSVSRYNQGEGVARSILWIRICFCEKK